MTTRLLCCVALATVVGAADALAQTPDPAILATVQALDVAWERRDTAAARRLLAPNYIYFSSVGNTRDGNWLLRLAASPDYHLDFVQRSEFEVHQLGGSAVVSSRWIGRGSYANEVINDDQRCSLVLAKQAAEWLLLSEHCTQIKPRP